MAFEVMKRTHRGRASAGISIGSKTITLPATYITRLNGENASWAMVYFDANTHRIAVELLEIQKHEDARKLMPSSRSFTRQIHIEALIHREHIHQYQYGIQASFEKINGRQMLVFSVEVEHGN